MSPPIYHSSMMCMYTAATKGLAHLIPEEATSFAKNFLQKCLVVDQTSRTSTKELLKVRSPIISVWRALDVVSDCFLAPMGDPTKFV